MMIRLAVGDSAEAVFSDAEIQAVWADAGTVYDEAARKRIVRQQVVVDLLEALTVDSARRVTYKQNDSSENLSDVSKRLESLLKTQQAKLAALIEADLGAGVRMGTATRIPSRDKEYPDA
jgi:hypothetical protein